MASASIRRKRLLDIFTIFDQKKSLDGLTITLVGDLKHGRTVHSLAKLIAYYDAADVRLCLVAPASLAMPREITDLVKAHGISGPPNRRIDGCDQPKAMSSIGRAYKKNVSKTPTNTAGSKTASS